MAKHTISERGLIWTTSPPSEKQLKKDGYTVVQFGNIRNDYIQPSRNVTAARLTLENAAAALLRLLDRNPRLAVLGVPANTVGDLRDIYSFLVEPAFHRDIDLLLGVNRNLEDLNPASLVAPDFGYPWTLERLHYVAQRYLQTPSMDGLPPLTPIEEQLLVAMKSAGLTPQVQYGIERFRVDFAFEPERLIVEADGRAWHDAERDAARDAYLKTLGWKTIRFSGSEIYRDVDGVVEGTIAALAEQTKVITFTDVTPAKPKISLWQRFLNWLRRSPVAKSRDPYADLPPVARTIPSWKAKLDVDQRRAVDSMEGVVQVIAPAGSGKTTTMIARVQELLSRGIPANRILCTTFNKATREELQDRLKELGIVGVDVKNFHALGRFILKEEDRLRSDIGTISYSQWRRLAMMAMNNVNGVWLDAPVSSEAVSNYKLAEMISPAEAARRGRTPIEITAAEIYRLYEDHLEEVDRHDFDDLIISSVRLLQTEADVRKRWQDKWEAILVDEYQDIEPAQELLVQMIAAPEDSIFAVGDEDQCIYAWRRATVERIVMLDTVYPGLERTVLTTSYRCPPLIVNAARGLISRNKRRFNKPIRANPKADYPGSIDYIEEPNSGKGAARVADLLAQASDPNEIVVLARTSRLLGDVVEACVNAGVPVHAPKNALRPTDAEGTLLGYLRLVSSPTTASESDVRTAMKVPNRYLQKDAGKAIATALNGGASFVDAAQSITLPANLAFAAAPQLAWAEIMDRLATLPDAAQIIAELRKVGGLDKHYASVDGMTPNDRTEIESLDKLLASATGKTPNALITEIELRAAILSNAKGGKGVELATIHGSKGREWDTVILYGADDTQLPHFRSLMEATTASELEDAIEDERRLAYVAITRTKKDLIVVTTGKPSPFLREAGISPKAGPVPTLAEIQNAKNSPVAPGTTTGKRLPPKKQQKKPNQPKKPKAAGTAIPAKFPGVCKKCKKPVTVGTMIINSDGSWIHENC